METLEKRSLFSNMAGGYACFFDELVGVGKVKDGRLNAGAANRGAKKPRGGRVFSHLTSY